METCIICFEQKTDVSRCTTCMESGISCHECDKKWVEAGNNKNICSVCKQHTKTNCFIEDVVVERPVNEPNIIFEEDDTFDEQVNYVLYVKQIWCWLLLTWALSSMGYEIYVEIFHVKKDNFWKDVHIALFCGFIVTCVFVSLRWFCHNRC